MTVTTTTGTPGTPSRHGDHLRTGQPERIVGLLRSCRSASRIGESESPATAIGHRDTGNRAGPRQLEVERQAEAIGGAVAAWQQADRQVVIGDGAAWIWNLCHVHFPGAIEIVDLYHARDHLWNPGRELFPLDRQQRRRLVLRRRKQLAEGRVEHLTRSLNSLRADTPEVAERVRLEAAYIEGHARRMRYAACRHPGLFVGSGVIEAGCGSVIGNRLKHSGTFWAVEGANSIIALRCAQLSNRFDDYWEDRAAA